MEWILILAVTFFAGMGAGLAASSAFVMPSPLILCRSSR